MSKWSAHVVSTAEPGTREWHEVRASGLGGSEVAALLGLSPFESRFSLWWRKQGRAPQKDSPEMEWGRRLEPVLRKKFADSHPELSVAVAPCTLANDDIPWMHANVDGLALEPESFEPLAVWEGKCAWSDVGWGPDGSDEIPVYYRPQVLWYLIVTGLSRAYVSVLISGSDYREYIIDIDRDDEADSAELDLLVSTAEEFIGSLPWDGRTGNPPDVDAHTETLRVMKALPAGVDADPVDVDEYLAEAYLKSVAEYRAAAEEKRYRTSQMLQALGDGKYAYSGGDKVATRVTNSDGETLKLMPTRKATQ